MDKKGKCICHTKLPCKCGAKVKAECTCGKLETICICDENKPNPVCTCRSSTVCVCKPGLPQPVCTCDKIEKPCVCYPDKFPYAICACGRKPKFGFFPMKIDEEVDFGGESASEEGEEEGEEIDGNGTISKNNIVKLSEENVRKISEKSISSMSQNSMGEIDKKTIIQNKLEEEEEPCVCQAPDPKPPCLCLKGKECTCNQDMCICGVRKSCVCEPVDSKEPIICKSQESKSICSCPELKECTCDAKSVDCKCFPSKPMCTCGDPENCKCGIPCDCPITCICDTLPKKEDECICMDKTKQVEAGLICTCPCKDEGKKLKRKRAGKHGYRWCHEVDPRHTFFDYGYDRHDKIAYKDEGPEKVKILGLHETKKEDVCPIHGIEAPPYKKQIRKPSLDCCSAVGG